MVKIINVLTVKNILIIWELPDIERRVGKNDKNKEKKWARIVDRLKREEKMKKNRIVEIDKEKFFELIQTTWFSIVVEKERKPVVLTPLIYAAFGQAQRAATMKRKRGQR